MNATEQAQEAAVNYAQEVLDELAGRLPDCDAPLLELYALLALVRGGGTTLENVHDAWAVWRNRTRPDHPALVQFIMLAPEVRELDRKYAEAIRESAAELGLGGAPDPEPSALPVPVTGFGPVRLELMGHRYREGCLSEVVIAGQPFLRLDLEGGAVEFYRPDAVYCITPGIVPAAPPRTAITSRFADDAWGDEGDDEPLEGGP